MVRIKDFGIADLEDYEREVEQGGRFVVFQYTISIIFFTFKEPSSIYFIRKGESAVMKGLKFNFFTLLLGWWGIPWEPIYTIQTLITNLSGGEDVTYEVMKAIREEIDPMSQYF
ncbi:MAG: hypothetical protein AAF740_00680 [Bacteroidota bacterium]